MLRVELHPWEGSVGGSSSVGVKSLVLPESMVARGLCHLAVSSVLWLGGWVEGVGCVLATRTYIVTASYQDKGRGGLVLPALESIEARDYTETLILTVGTNHGMLWHWVFSSFLDG